MIALCGCMMQEKEVVEKIKKTYRFVDLIFGTHNIFKLAELVSICLEERLEELEAQGREDKKPKPVTFLAQRLNKTERMLMITPAANIFFKFTTSFRSLRIPPL